MVACDYNCVAHGERGVMTVRLRRRHAVVIIRVCFCYRLTTFGPNIKHLFPSHTFFKTRAAPNFCSLVSKKIQRVLEGRAHTQDPLWLSVSTLSLSLAPSPVAAFFFLRALAATSLACDFGQGVARRSLEIAGFHVYRAYPPAVVLCVDTNDGWLLGGATQRIWFLIYGT
jgi:hypothetical protein